MTRSKLMKDPQVQAQVDAFLTALHKGMETMPAKPELSWGMVDGAVLQDAIASATEAGAGLLLSKTSDGGALTLILFWKNQKFKYFPVTVETAEDLLRDILSAGQAAQP